MEQNHESPVGAYGNLCATHFDYHCPHHGLKCFDIVPPSPQVRRVASDGDSGKIPDPILLPGTEIDRVFAANSVVQIHTFLVTLIRQFDFSLLGNRQEIKRMRSSGILSPVVAGEEHQGPQMPLKVTVLRNE